MKVLYLSPIGTIGGAERVLLDMVASLRRAENDFEIHVILGGDGPLLPALRDAGAEVTLLPMPKALARAGDSALIGATSATSRLRSALLSAQAAAQYAFALHRCVRRLNPDVIHSNGNKFHVLSRFTLGRSWPIVWHLHDFLAERFFMSRIVRRMHGGVACVIAISEAIAQDARRISNRLPIELIPNAIDTERFSPGPGDGAMLDRLAGFPTAAGILRIGLVATYARWKGQDLFLDAAALLPSHLPVRFFIVGGQVYKTTGSQFSAEELNRRIDELGLRHRVRLVGFQHDAPSVYRALDVVVHASTRPEPFGLTIVEAMSCGRPVIVAAAGGAVELFCHDRDAWGVIPGNKTELAAAIALLASNAELRSRLGASARHSAVQRFDRARLGPQLAAIYRRLHHR